MIVGKEFEGDSTRIGLIQHDCYNQALSIITPFAVSKHRHAEEVIGIRNEFSDLRDKFKKFDHRTLQGFHDRLAAAFRIEYCINTDLFIYATDNPHTDIDVIRFWFEFLRKELERIFEYNLELPRLILTAAIYPNPDQRGSDAEDELYHLTKNLYPDLN